MQVGKVSEEQRNQHWQKTSQDKEFVTNNHKLYHAVTLKQNFIMEINYNCLMLKISSAVQLCVDTLYF